MKKLFLFIILFFTVALFSASAQSIQGIVVDAESNSLQFVNVLQLRNDSTFNSGCITDERGAFKMEKADSSNWLKLSFVGYKDKFIPILGGQTDFDTIIMERILVEVDEVSVYARK